MPLWVNDRLVQDVVAGDKVLSVDSDAELEALLAPAKWDLALTPGRYASWTLLMGAYNQAAGTLVVRGLNYEICSRDSGRG